MYVCQYLCLSVSHTSFFVCLLSFCFYYIIICVIIDCQCLATKQQSIALHFCATCSMSLHGNRLVTWQINGPLCYNSLLSFISPSLHLLVCLCLFSLCLAVCLYSFVVYIFVACKFEFLHSIFRVLHPEQ